MTRIDAIGRLGLIGLLLSCGSAAVWGQPTAEPAKPVGVDWGTDHNLLVYFQGASKLLLNLQTGALRTADEAERRASRRFSRRAFDLGPNSPISPDEMTRTVRDMSASRDGRVVVM